MSHRISGFNRHTASFLLALSFFTRIPVGKYVAYSDEAMHDAGKYFALTGWLVALILYAFYSVLSLVFAPEISVFLMIALSLMLTGAFHEDGLADTADAFGGGRDRAHKLTIMKDSLLGTYGVCALTGALVGKWLLLSVLAAQDALLPALLTAVPLSRAFALSHVQHLPYATGDLSGKASKSMPFAVPYNTASMAFLFITGGLMLLFIPLAHSLLLLAACLLMRGVLKNRMQKHIQGFTGDTLGAAQQCQELLIYLFFTAVAGGNL